MDRRERTDAQLVANAVDGDVGAFAALVHRHAARVDAVVEHDTDPDARLVEVFTTTMTRLADAPEDVGAWVESIARATVRPRPEEPRDAPRVVTAVEPERLDAVWRELARRWPSGRAAPRTPTWLPWVTTAAVTIALSAGIPWWLLGPEAPEPDLMELRAFPLIEGPEAPVDEPDPVEEIPLPTFEFPVPPDEVEEPRAPEQPSAPDADPAADDQDPGADDDSGPDTDDDADPDVSDEDGSAPDGAAEDSA